MGGMQNNLNFRRREVNPVLTFSELVELFKTARKREEGQTMAEYGPARGAVLHPGGRFT